MTEFTLNLITLDSEHLQIPETEYCSEVTIGSGEFSKICKELYAISETVSVQTSSGSVAFQVEGEVGNGMVRLQPNNSDNKDDQIGLQVREAVDQQFALRYLNMFNKAACLSNFTRLKLHTEQPLVTEFAIEDLGVLKYYLAPKIADE